MQELSGGWNLLGLGTSLEELGAGQMALRTIVIYIAMLVIVRLANKRFLAEATAFDVIVAIILGSVMSRAINGSAPFMPTILAGVVLLGLHWLFSFLSYHTDWFGSLVKGSPQLLVEGGQLRQRGMRRSTITPADLQQALRLQTGQTDLSTVERAYLERNGQISFIRSEAGPRILDVSVKDGVETIRIILE